MRDGATHSSWAKTRPQMSHGHTEPFLRGDLSGDPHHRWKKGRPAACLAFDGQVQFQPLDYLLGLAAAKQSAIHEHGAATHGIAGDDVFADGVLGEVLRTGAARASGRVITSL